LRGTEPPDLGGGPVQKQLNSLWEDTKRWRIDCVQEAIEATRKIAGRGLRRGELYNAVARSLGAGEDYRVNNCGDLFLLPIGSPDKREALWTFCKWVTQCYHLNQANAFGVMPSFPGYEPVTIVVAGEALGASKSVAPYPEVVHIIESVPFPSVDALLRLPPAELLDWRKDLFPPFYAALLAWQREQSSSNETELRSKWKVYGSKLSEKAASRTDLAPALLEAVFGSPAKPSRRVLTAAVGALAGFASAVQPAVAPLVALGALGYAVFRYSAARSQKVDMQISVSRDRMSVRPEITLPAQEHNDKSPS